MKKGVLIGIIVGAVVLIIIVGFFVITSSSNNQGNNLSQDTFSSCQASTQTIPFVQGWTYTIKVIGIENGNCHWQSSLQPANSNPNQTKDCNYPIAEMSDKAFNHLFGEDKTGTECSSDVCKQQESLQQTYCTDI